MSFRPAGEVIIRRAVFPQDLPQVQACFVASHKTLHFRTLQVAVAHLRSCWQTYVVTALVEVLLLYLLVHFKVSHVAVWAAILPLLLFAALLLTMFQMSKSGWNKVVNKVIQSGDMSTALAPTVYNDPTNVCMIAVQRHFHHEMGPRDVILGSASILTGAAAEQYRTQRAGGTDHVTVGRVTRVGVLPQTHGKGVGRKLITALLAWAKDERKLTGLRLITSTAQGPAVGLYTSMGFATVSTHPINAIFGIHELLMECTFKP